MNFIRSMTRRPSSQSVRLMTSPERELFRDDGYDENFNEAVSMSAYVQGLYSDESDDVTVEDEFYANHYDLEAQAVEVMDLEAQDIIMTPREDMIDPNVIPDPPQLQRSSNVQPVYVGMEPRQLIFDGPEPLDVQELREATMGQVELPWDNDSLSTVSMTTDQDDFSDEEEEFRRGFVEATMGQVELPWDEEYSVSEL